MLHVGCGLQYEICLARDSSHPERQSPSKLCQEFCYSAKTCIEKYPEIKLIVSSTTLGYKYIDELIPTRCAIDDELHYCRFNEHEYDANDLNEHILQVLNPKALYKQWGVQECCAWAPDSSGEFCCNEENFYEVSEAKNCVLKCPNNNLYTETEKLLAFNWIIICATVCAVSSAITVLTYFADVSRFAYPEKPIICHSVCCFFYACGHFFRIFTGVEGVACTTIREGRVYLQEGLNGEFMCTVSFLIIYYSQMALHVWWVVLAISWFLTAVKGWSQEALEAISIWFHVSAWAIPTVQTVITLATKRFEGDPLTGLCVIGSQTAVNLLIFIIVPITICAVLGLLLITYGFVSVFQVRKRLRTTKIDANLSGVDTKRFDKLMIRMTVFTISYIVPTAAYLALTTYEFLQIPSWYESLNSNQTPFGLAPEETKANVPKIYLTLIKIFNPFVLCIGTCFWILNCKTLKLWSRVIFRCCHTPYDYNKTPVSVVHYTQSNNNLIVPANQYRVPPGNNNNNNNNSSPTPQNKNGKKSPNGQQNMQGYNSGINQTPASPTRYDMGKV